jgi:hypothetical protein
VNGIGNTTSDSTPPRLAAEITNIITESHRTEPLHLLRQPVIRDGVARAIWDAARKLATAIALCTVVGRAGPWSSSRDRKKAAPDPSSHPKNHHVPYPSIRLWLPGSAGDDVRVAAQIFGGAATTISKPTTLAGL